jgi:DUF1365 family protein
VNSALYEGKVRHRRFVPVRHEFAYRVALAYLDLDEVEADGAVLGHLDRRWRPLRYERRDYLGDPATPLSHAVRDLVEERTGERPTGPIALLANLRSAGWNFNPLSCYFCFDQRGELLEHVVLEVTSTPWGERTCHVVAPTAPGPVRDARFAKALHVSPFLPMDLEYRFSAGVPGERCDVRFELWRDEVRVFDADLWCTRSGALGPTSLLRLGLRHPLMPLRVSAAIYLQAARLAAKRVGFYPHPARGGRAVARAAGEKRPVSGRPGGVPGPSDRREVA